MPSRLFAVAFLLVFAVFLAANTTASPLTSKSITVGSSLPSATTTHTIRFNIPTVSSIGSIEFEYCTNTPFEGTPCTAPVGLNLSGVSLASQTGETGFSIDPASTANRIVLTRPASLTSIGTATYRFTNAVNQSAPNSYAYVRISTFASLDATGPRTDTGAVAYSTSQALSVNGYVPPYLTFCVGITVSLNCTSINGEFNGFGELSKTSPNFASSQFSIATNDPSGYTTSVFGLTMTSGTNIIPALTVPTASQPGVSQFGINLRSNTNPSVGANPSGLGTGSIATGYNVPNQFKFANGIVASSALPSNFNLFTVSYLINVGPSQKPGIYSTTMTYVASVAF